MASGVFNEQIKAPGNEFLNSSVQGYSTNLIQTNNDTANFDTLWQEGVTTFKNGYNECNDAYLMLSAVPAIQDSAGKNAAWETMHTGRIDIVKSVDLFTAAKSYASPGSSIGFTIGLVLPLIDQIETNAEVAELASINATLADRDNNKTGFETNLKEVGTAIGEMNRIYPDSR